jgi:hypothetical protein
MNWNEFFLSMKSVENGICALEKIQSRILLAFLPGALCSRRYDIAHFHNSNEFLYELFIRICWLVLSRACYQEVADGVCGGLERIFSISD